MGDKVAARGYMRSGDQPSTIRNRSEVLVDAVFVSLTLRVQRGIQSNQKKQDYSDAKDGQRKPKTELPTSATSWVDLAPIREGSVEDLAEVGGKTVLIV